MGGQWAGPARTTTTTRTNAATVTRSGELLARNFARQMDSEILQRATSFLRLMLSTMIH